MRHYLEKILFIISFFATFTVSKPVKIYQTQEVHLGYDENEMDTIKKQALYFKNLGYEYVEYNPQMPDLYKITRIDKSGFGFSSDEKKNTIKIFKEVKQVLNDIGLKVIPLLINTLSHRTDVIQFYPEYSFVPPIKNICLLTANSRDSIKELPSLSNMLSTFKITLKNKLLTGLYNNIFVYLLWDESEVEENYPDWLKNNFTFTKTDPIWFSVVNSNSPDKVIKYKLFRSKKELSPGQSIELFGFQNTKRDKMMYLVMVARSRYDAAADQELGELRSECNQIEVIVSKSTSNSDYKWVSLNYNDSIAVFPYSNSTTYSVKKDNSPDKFVNISGIPPFVAHMNNALQNGIFMEGKNDPYDGDQYDDLGCITRPVDYNGCPRGNIITNVHSKNLVDYYLDCIHEAFQIGKTGVYEEPDIIEIGHDELGYNTLCFVCPPKGQTKSQLVAAEIADIINKIDSKFSNKPLIKLHGDSFTPFDYGSTYDMCGNTLTGSGGVLQILKDTYKLADRIIVSCWMYDMIDGTYEPGRNQIHDKWEIIKYLNNLGYKFITYGGEEFPLVENLNGYNRVFQCGFEWLKAGQQFSQNWFGYEHGIWRKWDNRRNPVNSATYGQLAALSSYAVKFPYLITAYAPFTKPKYNLNNFSGIDFKKIRDTLNWNENVNYVKPLVVEHIGDTLDISMVANYTNNFNEYNLQGNSADYSVQDKPLFAFVQSEVNQTLTVSLTHNDSVKKGIMLRDNLRENCNSIYFYCQNGKTGIERRTRGSSKISYPKLLFTPPISTSSILMVEHLGTEIKFYVSNDGKTNILLLTISKSQLASGFLIGVANSNSTSTVGMTYKIKWGESFN